MRLTCEEIGWRNYRYAACGDCGKVYNIAIKQDTSRGYLCPGCTGKRRKKRVSQEQDDNGARRTAHDGMAPEGSGSQRAESRPEGQDRAV